LGLSKLRKAIGIIPQENQGFQGTIRSNLNPFAEHEDKELWQALEDAQLKDFVSGLEEGLDAPVSIGGSNLSAGQLQQLGLARALLQRTPIVVLDEATSSLDLETDSIVQRTIRKSFANATVITIAHRISTILDSDMVVVMDAGTVAEVGPPSDLLNSEGGLFATLVREAGLDA
jgi:ABC-type multidrug transport system fused ATPase/permease subunit